jgi:hypothetical protein
MKDPTYSRNYKVINVTHEEKLIRGEKKNACFKCGIEFPESLNECLKERCWSINLEPPPNSLPLLCCNNEDCKIETKNFTDTCEIKLTFKNRKIKKYYGQSFAVDKARSWFIYV